MMLFIKKNTRILLFLFIIFIIFALINLFSFFILGRNIYPAEISRMMFGKRYYLMLATPYILGCKYLLTKKIRFVELIRKKDMMNYYYNNNIFIELTLLGIFILLIFDVIYYLLKYKSIAYIISVCIIIGFSTKSTNIDILNKYFIFIIPSILLLEYIIYIILVRNDRILI